MALTPEQIAQMQQIAGITPRTIEPDRFAEMQRIATGQLGRDVTQEAPKMDLSQPKQQIMDQRNLQLKQAPELGLFETGVQDIQRATAGVGGFQQAITGRGLENKLEGILQGSLWTAGGLAKVGTAKLMDGLSWIADKITPDKVGEAVKESAKSTFQSFWNSIDEEQQQSILNGLEKAQEFFEGDRTLAGQQAERNRSAILNILEWIPISRGAKFAGKALEEPVEQVFKKGGELIEETGEFLGRAAREFGNKLSKSKNIESDIIKGLNEGIIQRFEADQLAKQFGVELPAGALARPSLAKTEQILGEGFFGGKIKERAEKAISDFSEKLNAIQSKALTSGELGEEIVKKFSTVEKSRRKIIQDLYSRADDLAKQAGDDILVEPSRAQSILSKLEERKRNALKAGLGSEAERATLENVFLGLEANRDLTTMRAALKEIGDLASFDKFDPTTDEKTFRTLYKALKSDIDDAIIEGAPDVGIVLKKANKEFADFEALRQRPFAKTIKKLGKTGDIDTVADRLTKTKVSTNEIEQIYKTLGKDTTAKVQDKMISDIIEKAKSPAGGFTPAGFSKQIQTIGDERMKVLFTKEQRGLLDNIDKVNNLIAKGTAITRGSQTALIQQVTGALKTVAAGVTGGASLLGEFILGRWFGSPKGQAFLKGLPEKIVDQLRVAASQGKKLRTLIP